MEKVITSPNMSKILKQKHLHKWVAFTPDYKKIVAVANTLSEVIKKSGKKDVGVMHVLPNIGYAPMSL